MRQAIPQQTKRMRNATSVSIGFVYAQHMDKIDSIISFLDSAFDDAPCWREHALIQALKASDIAPFNALKLSNKLELFKAHFLIRHVLYTLRSQWRREAKAELSIEAVEIKRQPLSVVNRHTTASYTIIGAPDLLEQYYLDITNLYETTEAEVELMLKGFWQRVQSPLSSEEAFRTLGLKSDASYQEIKKAFRAQAQKAHPDKGGNESEFQALADARDTLLSTKAKPKA